METNVASVQSGRLCVDTDASYEAVRDVLKHLAALGADMDKVRVESRAQFASRADHVFATDLRLLGVRKGTDFLKVSLDGDEDTARPLAARVRIVWG